MTAQTLNEKTAGIRAFFGSGERQNDPDHSGLKALYRKELADHLPLDRAGGDQQTVVPDHGAQRLFHVLFRHGREEGCDHPRVFRCGDNVLRQALAQRVFPVAHQQAAVKLHLNLRVGNPTDLDLLLHIPVAGGIQGEMAQKSAQIRQPLIPHGRGIKLNTNVPRGTPEFYKHVTKIRRQEALESGIMKRYPDRRNK